MSLNPQLGSAPITAGALTVVDRANLSLSYASGSGSLFRSTFTTVPIPGNTSTILMEMPAGQFGFNGLYTQLGAAAYLNGFINTASNPVGPFYYGSILDIAASQPADTAPVEMTINNGDVAVSTIKLIVANNNVTSGTFTGVVSKLYS